MPATPVYGIEYPCSGATIDPSVLSDFALSMDAALAQGTVDLARVTSRPNAQMTSTVSQPVIINTSTNLTFATEVYDNDSIIDLATNNEILTIRTAGVYLVWGSFRMLDGYTTLTSAVVILAKNGVEQGRRVDTTDDIEYGVTMPMYLAVGDFIQMRALWNGTGGPANVTKRILSASFLAAPTV